MDPLLNQPSPYLDLGRLSTLYPNLKYPKDKIRRLVEEEHLIKVRRDFYLLSPAYGRPYSKETVANMLYGPSYISFQYALSWHGLIPERVETLTSICCKKEKVFRTPLGVFTYAYLHPKKYPIGVELKSASGGNFHIASPEKALCDQAAQEKIESPDVVEHWLLEHMRMDRKVLTELNLPLLHQIARVYRKASVDLVVGAINDWNT